MELWRCFKLVKRNNIYLMYTVVFLQGFVFYGPIATLYRQSRGISMNEIFILESIFMVLMILFEIPWGYFADRFGYKNTLVISNLLFLLSKIIFYKANSFFMFSMEAIAVALAVSGLSGCDTALIYSSIDEEDSEKVFGRYDAFSTGGFLIASTLSTVIITKSMDYAVFLTIIPYALASLLTLFIEDVKINNKEKISIKGSIKNALSNKWILIFVLCISLINEVTHSISVFLNQSQYIKSGIDIKYFGIIIVAMQIVSLTSVKAYKLTKRFGQGKIIKVLFGIIALSSILLGYTSNSIMSIILIALINGSFAIVAPISTDIQNKSIATKDRVSILSIYAMIGNISAAVVNLSLGVVAEASIEYAFIYCGVISIIALIFIYVYFNRIRKFDNISRKV